jgi:hypothetical protein
LLSALAFGAPSARAQDAADDALDRLLEKAEEKEKAADAKADEKKDDAKADKADTRPSDARPADAKKAESRPKKKPGAEDEVADKDLDNLLKGLSETEDEPEAKGKPQAMPGGEEGEPKPAGAGGDQQPEDANAAKIKGRTKDLDEHLEELTGRKRRRNQDEGDPNSPLAQTIKKMDDVDKKLEEQDTGEETRKKQQQIVEELKTMIKQAQTRRMRVRSNQQAQNGQPGQQQGDQPNNTGDGVGPQTPKKYEAKSVLARNKDEWGGLPPQLRGEMENVFKEDALPQRKTLIDRYYLSISQKSTGRSE